MGKVPSAMAKVVRLRASERCEYCLIREADLRHGISAFHVEHIRPRSHLRREGLALHDETRLALACPRCNLIKGAKVTGRDPEDGTQPLFNPRSASWADHFHAMPSGQIRGRTSVGRATVTTLKFNVDPDAIRGRAKLFRERSWPSAT